MRETAQPKKQKFVLLALVLLLVLASDSNADDGYRLWLRYDPLPARSSHEYGALIKSLQVTGRSLTSDAIRSELDQGLTGLLDKRIPQSDGFSDGAVVVGTPTNSSFIASLGLPLSGLGPEGYLIRRIRIDKKFATVIAANGEIGALYGSFHFLRLLQTLQPIRNLNISSKPKLQVRMLSHWDGVDGSIERGYAGKSLWNWAQLPENVDARYRDYAGANASIGINCAVLNNVNADAEFLRPDYIRKVAAIAAVFSQYGIKVYLSAKFSAPIEVGGLNTADPLDEKVIQWWKNKAAEIYSLIPDFGGFLVKADSEGEPGPRLYNRTHVDGANMIARAVAPHKGVVIWRAFVYDHKPGYDRAAASYDYFKPLDGQFLPNVSLQVKNGPIDFQPREPFHPLFGAMPNTNVVPEVQITQEYLGFANHLAFLAPMWREFLSADTYAKGKGSTVARVADGSLFDQKLTGIAGVANTGTDRNWTGHHLLQANWYSFGRLAWDPDLPSDRIAKEWVVMSLTKDPKAVDVIVRLLLESHDQVVNYMMPLGLHHLMAWGHHYGPAPWWNSPMRDDYSRPYYHKADAAGIGFDRTLTGSNAIGQYFPAVRTQFSDLRRIPDKYLLWFHHVGWGHRMRSGNTLWDEIALRYQRGVDWVRKVRKEWDGLEGVIDAERHTAVKKKLAIQERDAVWWKDAMLSYFQTFSKLPLPHGVEKPQRTLDEYKRIDLYDDHARGIKTLERN